MVGLLAERTSLEVEAVSFPKKDGQKDTESHNQVYKEYNIFHMALF